VAEREGVAQVAPVAEQRGVPALAEPPARQARVPLRRERRVLQKRVRWAAERTQIRRVSALMEQLAPIRSTIRTEIAVTAAKREDDRSAAKHKRMAPPEWSCSPGGALSDTSGSLGWSGAFQVYHSANRAGIPLELSATFRRLPNK
jgi:hypothetical protein